MNRYKADRSAPYGWTVVRKHVLKSRAKDAPEVESFTVYKRDCPADEKHFAADLAAFTYPTRKDAVAAGERGEYAYRRRP